MDDYMLFDDEECLMCEMTGAEVRDRCITTICGHKFHEFCLADYYEGHPYCPKCEMYLSDMTAGRFLKEKNVKIKAMELKLGQQTRLMNQKNVQEKEMKDKIRSLEQQLASANDKLSKYESGSGNSKNCKLKAKKAEPLVVRMSDSDHLRPSWDYPRH